MSVRAYSRSPSANDLQPRGGTGTHFRTVGDVLTLGESILMFQLVHALPKRRPRPAARMIHLLNHDAYLPQA